MNTRRCIICFGAVLVGLVFLLQQGCTEQSALSWNSSKMNRLKERWTSLWESYRKTPEKIPGEFGQDKYAEAIRMEQRLFQEHITRQDAGQLASSCGTLPAGAKERGELEEVVLGFVVSVLVDAGDRDGLVTMLSTRCPSRVTRLECIEFYLAKQKETLRDPILILGEAFSRARDAGVRRDLAAAVRRGFGGLGIVGKDDAEYVKNAMQWYEKEKAHLTVNPSYLLNDQRCPVEVYERHPRYYETFVPTFERELLFKTKP